MTVEQFLVRVTADATQFQRRMAEVDAQIRNAGSGGTVDISADISDFLANMQQVRAQAQALNGQDVHVEVQGMIGDVMADIARVEARARALDMSDPTVDIHANVAGFMLDMARIQAAVATITQRNHELNIDADVNGLMAKLAMLKAKWQALTGSGEKFIKTFQGKIQNLATNIRAFGEVLGYAFRGTLMAVLPAIAPLLANLGALIGNLGVMVGVLAGQFAGFGFAALTALAGFGGAAALAIGSIKQLYEDGAKLNAQQTATKAAIDSIKTTYDNLVKATEKPILQGVQKGAQVVTSLLKKLEPMFMSAANAFNSLMTSLKQSIGTPPVQAFIEYLNTNAGPMMTTFGKAIGNVLQGVGSMMVAFGPLAQSVSQGFLQMTESFAQWAAKLGESEKFQAFISYVQENMPKISSIFGNAITGIVNFFAAFGDSASGMMTSLQGLMERWVAWTDALGQNQAFQNFLSYVASTAPSVMSLIGQLTTFLVNLGIGMGQIAPTILNLVNSFLEWSNSMMQAHPNIAKFIALAISISGVLMAVAPAFIMVKTALLQLGPAFLKIGAWLVSLSGSIIPAFGAVMGALAGPIGIAIAAITLLAGAVYLIITNWSSITEFFSNLWTSIQNIFTTVVTAIGSFLSSAWSAIVSTATSVFTALSSFFSTVWSGISAIFTGVWNGIKSALTAIWNGLKTVATTAFNAIKSSITAIWNGIKTVTSTVWNSIKSFLSSLWNGIKSAATAWANGIKTVIVTIWNGIKTVTSTVWNGIKSLLTSVWNGLKSAASAWANGVKTVITTAWNLIKSITTSVWNGIKSFITSAWNGIKSAVTSAVNAVKSKVTSVWNAIKSTTSSVWNGIKSFITSVWNGIKSTISSVSSAIKSVVTSTWNSIKSTVSNIMNSIKSTITNIWNSIKSFLAGINLTSIGRNIMQGLLNGISAVGEKVIAKAKSIANAVTNTIKKAMGVHSPSRVTHAIGEFVSIGFANGIAAKTKNVTKSAKAVANAAKTAFNDATKNLDLRLSAGSISTATYVKEAKALAQKYKSVTNAVATVNAKVAQAQTKAAQKAQAEAHKKYLERQKTFNDKVAALDNQYKAGSIGAETYTTKMEALGKTYKDITNATSKTAAKVAGLNKELMNAKLTQIKNNYDNGDYTLEKYIKKLEQTKEKYKSVKGAEVKIDKELATARYELNKQTVDAILQDETIGANKQIALIQSISKEYARGSQKRQYFDEQTQKAKQALYDNLTTINETYTKKIQDANDKLAESEKKLNEDYEKAFSDRKNTLYTFAGLFDEVAEKTAKTGGELIGNLQNQVKTMSEWASNINSLAGRGVDAALLEELRDMGVKSASEIASLNNMTDDQLDEFVKLWREKTSLANDIATSELTDLRKSTNDEIVKLREETTTELGKYGEEWTAEITAITQGTTKSFNAMTSSMKGIGKNVIKGLVNGLNATSGELDAKVDEITSKIKGSIQDAFDIHSPSRWAKKFIGVNIVQGLINGMSSMQTRAVATAATLAEEVKNSMTSNLVAADVLGYTTSASSAISEELSVSVKVQVEGDGSNGSGVVNHIYNQYDSTPSSPAELARQQRKQLERLGQAYR